MIEFDDVNYNEEDDVDIYLHEDDTNIQQDECQYCCNGCNNCLMTGW